MHAGIFSSHIIIWMLTVIPADTLYNGWMEA